MCNMLAQEVISTADCSQWWIPELGLFPLIPNYTSMPSLILFLFELKENTSPEQFNCLFCYSKLRFSLHRKQKLESTWNFQYCKYSLLWKIHFFFSACAHRALQTTFKNHAAKNKKKNLFTFPPLTWIYTFFFLSPNDNFNWTISACFVFLSISLQPCK